MDNSLTRKKFVLLILLVSGFSIGMLADPIENFSSVKAHLVLAIVLALGLPLWLLLVGSIERFFSGGQTRWVCIKASWVAWISLGIFAGRLFQLFSAGREFFGSVLLASPFLGIFTGIMLFRILRGRFQGGVGRV